MLPTLQRLSRLKAKVPSVFAATTIGAGTLAWPQTTWKRNYQAHCRVRLTAHTCPHTLHTHTHTQTNRQASPASGERLKVIKVA